MKKLTWLLIGIVLLLVSGYLSAFIPTSPTHAQELDSLPLAVDGPYGVGFQWLTLVDESRESRELRTAIWYPAIIPEDETENSQLFGLMDGMPDSSAAPYPLIFYSHGYGGTATEAAYFNGHLASHGFVVAAMNHHCGNAPTCLTDRPLDILYLLDQFALDLVNLADLVDTNTVGVAGYSDGGYTALALSGAQIDPEYFLSWYAEHQDDPTVLDIDLWIPPWDEISAYRTQFNPPLEEAELWPAFFDERIQAVMPMAPCYGPLFGDRGLAETHLPIFLVAGTSDIDCSYERDAVFMYEHLGSEERYLLSFINQGHLVGVNPLFVDYFKHFSTAFFGFYLQGQEVYANYLTEAFVTDFDDLQWGAYEGE